MARSRPIRARLQYLASGDDGDAVYHASQAGGTAADHDGQYDVREVAIKDGRGHDFDLDAAGFMLIPHVSAMTDFHDDAALAAVQAEAVPAPARPAAAELTEAGVATTFGTLAAATSVLQLR
ncbi:MAG: hypothetical protein ACPH8C_08390, partial [Candidatus Puniceispirillaceae bacterium]